MSVGIIGKSYVVRPVYLEATAPITLLRTWFIMLTQDYCATSAMPIPLAITLWMYFPPLVLATAVCLTLI